GVNAGEHRPREIRAREVRAFQTAVRGVELRWRNNLLRASGLSPKQPRHGRSDVVEVLQENVVILPGDQGNGAGVFRRAVAGPVIDEQLAVDPQAYPLVRNRMEQVTAGVPGLQLAHPTDRETIWRNRRSRRGEAPIEIDCRIDAGQRQAGEIWIRVI